MPDPIRPELDVPVLLTTVGDDPAPLPHYAMPGDAGADLTAAEDVDLAPFQRALVGTGVAVAIPEGYAGFVHPRSGLAHRVGLSMVNAPRTLSGSSSTGTKRARTTGGHGSVDTVLEGRI